MKKHVLLLVALMGMALYSCSGGDEETPVTEKPDLNPSISYTTVTDAQVIELDIENKSAGFLFSWEDVAGGAQSFEFVISKDAGFSSANTISIPITTSGIGYTHDELQALLIDPDNFGLKRYLENSLYWNVKSNGSYLYSTPKTFKLYGEKYFKDVRGEHIDYYDVAVITYLDGKQQAWLANDLRARHTRDGRPICVMGHHFDGKLNPDDEDPGKPGCKCSETTHAHARLIETPLMADGGFIYSNDPPADAFYIPQAWIDATGLYYFQYNVVNGDPWDGPASLRNGDTTFPDLVTPTDWRLPTRTEWNKLIEAAVAVSPRVEVLKNPEFYASESRQDKSKLGLWKMNFIPTYRAVFYWNFSIPVAPVQYNYDAGWQYWMAIDETGRLSENEQMGKAFWVYADYLPDGTSPALQEIESFYAHCRLVYTGR
jgi:hypothetical protein